MYDSIPDNRIVLMFFGNHRELRLQYTQFILYYYIITRLPENRKGLGKIPVGKNS